MRLLRMPVLGALAGLALIAPTQVRAQEKIDLEGAISAVNGTRIELFGGIVSFEARGAKIETDDENFTNVSDLKIGTVVEVEAVASLDGSIQATLIEVSDEKDAGPEVGGVIGTVDTAAQTFTIGPLTIAWDGQTKFKDLPRPQAGQLVEAAVQVSGGRLLATTVEREEARE